MANNPSDEVVKTTPVYRTTNYKQFKKINGNREPDPGHVNALVKSMVENGNLTEDDPIEITKDWGVFDGQTRLAACERLGIPVCYKFREGGTVKEMRVANTYRRNWNWVDYAVSFRDEQNNPHYRDLLELHAEYKLTFGILMTYCDIPAYDARWLRDVFFKGDFVITDLTNVRKMLDAYQEYVKITDIKSRNFARAVARFMKNPTYNHHNMINKLRIHKKALNNCYLEQDYLFTLQDIWRA